MKQLVIIGASGHGKVVAEIARSNGYDDIVFLDDKPSLKSCGGYPVVGTSDRCADFDRDMIVAIGNSEVREKLFVMLERFGKKIPVLIHPFTYVAEDVTLGQGTVVMAGAVINPGTKIGKGCIVNTSASVDHDCALEDFVHVSVGAHVAGNVNIKKNTWIGAGATVSNNVNICGGCMIGAGAVVIRDIIESGTYIGLPARKLVMGMS